MDEAVAAIQEADEIYINAIVMGELLAGFAHGNRSKKHEAELAEFLESPRVNIIDLDEDTASRYAVILNELRSAGAMAPTNDVWIAASAMQPRPCSMDFGYSRSTRTFEESRRS